MVYDDFCKSKRCDHYVEWSYYSKQLISCKLIGTSEHIEKYPKECPFIDEIIDYNPE